MNLIFSTALPRSGTGLFTRSLNESKQVMMAVGPNIEIYRFHRNSLIRKYGSSNLKKKINNKSPIQDYFGDKYKNELLKLMLNSSLEEKFEKKLWGSFLKASKSRIDHDSSDLTKSFSKLKGDTYKDIIINLIKIIQHERKSHKRKYNGFNESWNICSLKSMAKAFPKAKFFIVIRDPRAIWAALEKNASKRNELRVQLLSFIRHFRKYIILASYYLDLPIFKDRLMIYKFEDFVSHPSKTLKKVCKFLGIKYQKKMISVKNFHDFNKKTKWKTNSAFNFQFNKFDKRPIFNWKKYLSESEIATIEFLCGYELRAANYKLMTKENKLPVKQIIKNLKKDYQKKVNWRTDHNNFEKDKKIEILRRKILKRKIKNNNQLIEKCFLFKDFSFKSLRQHLKN